MRPLEEVEVFLVKHLPPGKWYWAHHVPKPIYHWLAAHMQPGTLKEFLLKRPSIFIVQDSKTPDAKWKFMVIKHVLPPGIPQQPPGIPQPPPGISQAGTAQAPTQPPQNLSPPSSQAVTAPAQAPTPQPPQNPSPHSSQAVTAQAPTPQPQPAGISQAAQAPTAQAPTAQPPHHPSLPPQAVTAQAPTPQPPPPGISQAPPNPSPLSVVTKPVPTQPPPGLTPLPGTVPAVNVPHHHPPPPFRVSWIVKPKQELVCEPIPSGQSGQCAEATVESKGTPGVSLESEADRVAEFQARIMARAEQRGETGVLLALQDGRGLRQRGGRAPPADAAPQVSPPSLVGLVTAQAPDPINTPQEAPAAVIPTPPPPEPRVPPPREPQVASAAQGLEAAAAEPVVDAPNNTMMVGGGSPHPPAANLEELD